MSATPHHRINQLRGRYALYQVLGYALMVTGAGLLLQSVLRPFISNTWLIPGLVIVAVGWLIWKLRTFPWNANHFVRYLNQHYPALQQSADLLLVSPDKLSLLGRLQQQRIRGEFDRIYPIIRMPHQLLPATGIFLVGITSSLILSSYYIPGTSVQPNRTTIKVNEGPKIPASISTFEVYIQPPAYTRKRAYVGTPESFQVPEGSVVTWTLKFQNPVTAVWLIFSQGDSLKLSSTTEAFNLERTLHRSGFYQVKWVDEDQTQWSDFYRYEVIPDQAPKITIRSPEPFTERSWSELAGLEVVADLEDDYGLFAAGLVATVSKGSGEGVKFREERFAFESPATIGGLKQSARRTLDLKKLGLDPGDELYFYVEAFDTKQPKANRSRTDTYFVSIPDTVALEVVADEGLGIDVMPDYFRSQRQIIIDSEKLLRQKSKLAKHEFNATSNELGFDQKSLRLKYGQFLGEEEDSGIFTGSTAEEGEAEHEEHEAKEDPEGKELLKEFGHQHDTENEHHLVEDKKGHSHAEGEEAEEDPLAAFIHSHDNEEEATFFEQSVRAKLKAALTVMWDAELYLRMYQPEKSLPYQYTALRLLKEISNDSRIYVHRTGFDPPPLKEEKRLSGDLSEVKSPRRTTAVDANDEFIAIRQALELLDGMENEKAMNGTTREVFRRAGNEYAGVVLRDPALLPGLSILQRLAAGNTSQLEKDLVLGRKYLWLALPARPPQSGPESGTLHALEVEFLNQLDKAHD